MSRTQSWATLAAGFAALLLAILDQTIVTSTAAPIGRELDPSGGVSEIPWLVAAYMLAATCVQPLYGKLVDRLGPRRVFLMTLGLFLAGSGLCASATSISELIAFRAIQGLGGGGLLAVTIVALAHLRYEQAQRSTGGDGGNLAAAALVGIGLVLGPTVGGQIVAHLSWRWVFLINLPLGGVAWVTAWWAMRPRFRGQPVKLDLLGSALLGICAASLLLACQWGGQRYAWRSWPIVGLGVCALTAACAFVVRQARVKEPLFPMQVLAMRNVRTIAILQLLVGIGITGSAIYLTVELQLIHGLSPAATGVHLIPMAAGLGLGSLLGRRLLADLATLTRAIALSSLFAAATFGALALLDAGTPYWLLAMLLMLLGVGNGVGLGTEVIALQQTVERCHLGIATAGVRFVETLGGALSASGLGVLFTAGLHGHGPVAVTAAVRPIFTICAAVMTLAALAAMRMPLAAPLPQTSEAAAQHRSRGQNN